jgi:hypothetical protein
MISVPQTIDDWTKLVEDGTPFTYANIGGDGEFLAIVGKIGTNSDGRAFNPEVGKVLSQVLIEPRLTFHGYNPGRPGSEKRLAAEAWLREHGINVPELDPHRLTDPDFGKCERNVRWVHKEIISSANVRGELGPFIGTLRSHPLIVVGPSTLDESFVLGTLDAVGFIAVPPDRGLDDLEGLYLDITDEIDAVRAANEGRSVVVSWSLGYPAKPLIWRLASEFPAVTQIDMGACWDPYCGVRNRHGYKRDTWPEAMARNLREAGVG